MVTSWLSSLLHTLIALQGLFRTTALAVFSFRIFYWGKKDGWVFEEFNALQPWKIAMNGRTAKIN